MDFGNQLQEYILLMSKTQCTSGHGCTWNESRSCCSFSVPHARAAGFCSWREKLCLFFAYNRRDYAQNIHEYIVRMHELKNTYSDIWQLFVNGDFTGSGSEVQILKATSSLFARMLETWKCVIGTQVFAYTQTERCCNQTDPSTHNSTDKSTEIHMLENLVKTVDQRGSQMLDRRIMDRSVNTAQSACQWDRPRWFDWRFL